MQDSCSPCCSWGFLRSRRGQGTFLGASKPPPMGVQVKSRLPTPQPTLIKGLFNCLSSGSPAAPLSPNPGTSGPSAGLAAKWWAGEGLQCTLVLPTVGSGPWLHPTSLCLVCPEPLVLRVSRGARGPHSSSLWNRGAVATLDKPAAYVLHLCLQRFCVLSFFKCLKIFYSGNFNFKEKKQTGANVRKYKP